MFRPPCQVKLVQNGDEAGSKFLQTNNMEEEKVGGVLTKKNLFRLD